MRRRYLRIRSSLILGSFNCSGNKIASHVEDPGAYLASRQVANYSFGVRPEVHDSCIGEFTPTVRISCFGTKRLGVLKRRLAPWAISNLGEIRPCLLCSFITNTMIALGERKWPRSTTLEYNRNPTGLIEDTDKNSRIHHSNSKKQPQKHKSRVLGLHTRRKSYTFKDIVKAVALLAISTKHCRR